jgi:hypothetical protein
MYRQTTEEANTNQYTNKRLFHGKFLSRNQKRKIMENPNTTKSKIPTVDELIRSNNEFEIYISEPTTDPETIDYNAEVDQDISAITTTTTDSSSTQTNVTVDTTSLQNSTFTEEGYLPHQVTSLSNLKKPH